MSALQIFYSGFDESFFDLPPNIRERIESGIDELGRRLRTFPHHRLKGSDRCRLRIGDYRVIYTVDIDQNTIHLLGVGHRREIYRR